MSIFSNLNTVVNYNVIREKELAMSKRVLSFNVVLVENLSDLAGQVILESKLSSRYLRLEVYFDYYSDFRDDTVKALLADAMGNIHSLSYDFIDWLDVEVNPRGWKKQLTIRASHD